MSISDEDTASTTSKRSTKSPPRKIRHRNPNNKDIVTKKGATASNRTTLPLTKEEIVEYARWQVDKVLNDTTKYDEGTTIAVIPSLVSLSTDFFTGRFNDVNANESDSNNDIYGTAAAASAVGTSSSFDFQSSFPTLDGGGDNNASSAPSVRLMPRQINNRGVLASGGDLSRGNNNTRQQTREGAVTPPIGPQGAPIPQHIVSRLENRGIATAAASSESNSELEEEPSSPNPRHIFSTDYQSTNIQLSAPARLGQSLYKSSRNHDVQSNSRHINVVSSLADAVERMERRIEEGEAAAANAMNHSSTAYLGDRQSGTTPRQAPLTPRRTNLSTNATPVPSTPKQLLHKDNIDELECSTVTKLAEIMLHPPIGKVVEKCEDNKEVTVRYVWKDDEGRKKDVMDHSPMKGFEEVDDDYTDTQQRKSRYPTSQSAHASIASLGLSIPRRVCQHPFRRNDIVWVCRTCQSDETCVLCHECFTNSNHEGHDVAFYHAQAGGCCDCGDADAWDPKGFCSKHGVAKGAPEGSAVAAVEPSVLGGVHACADWLVGVVSNGVEGAYRRANPALFTDNKSENDERRALGRSESSSANCDRQDRVDARQMIEVKRQHSLSRRNTVADVESMDVQASPGEDDRDAAMPDSSAVQSNMFHEVQFNPAAASASKKWLDTKPEALLVDSADLSPVFDPEAAGSRAAKKAKAPSEQSPARILGDLGRREHGLFLVLHADDIKTGATQPTEAIEALKELYSSPGGGSRSDTAASILAGPHIPGTFVTATGPAPRLAPRFGHDPNRFLFRAPQADAIISKIIRLVQKHGDCIVWGTQEIIAECRDVISKTWLDGDSESSKLIGAAMLDRAKILTDRGLVCSIKTYRDIRNDQKATGIIRLIASMAECCDALCDEVSSGLSGNETISTLSAIIRSDLKLVCKFTKSWHALLLTLLAQPEFKAALAVAYCNTYRTVFKEYARGVGVVERSSFTLSVQFLNRVTYVESLVRERNLLARLSKSLLETMTSASFVPGSLGSPPPAGASADTIVQLSTLHTERSNLAAVLTALFGSFSFDGDEQFVLMELDNELDNLMSDLGRHSSGGGDSRYHGRSSIPRIAEENPEQSSQQVTLQSLIKRTQALVNPTLNPTHPFLLHRRYSPCISDLKCVLNVKGMARIFLSFPCAAAAGDGDDQPSTNSESDDNAFENWLKTLSLAQNMDCQMWRSFNMGHIESEHRGWVGAFNTSISLGSVFERLLNWEDTDPCIFGDKNLKLLRCVEVAHYTITTTLHRWQRSEMLSYRSTPHPSYTTNVPPHALCPASLPFSTVASAHGTNLAMAALPLSQIQMWSFHLPLHRFAAACVREVARRPGDGGIADLLHMLDVPKDASNSKYQTRQNALLFRGIMEFPLIILSRSAQVRAGLWRRNGPGMTDQVLNYCEPPFCKSLQDSDYLLVQFSLICHTLLQSQSSDDAVGLFMGQSGTSRLVNLLLHRYGVFDFLGFESAPSADIERYVGEVDAGLYPREIIPSLAANREERSPSNALPWTYSPARDFAMSISLVEELLMFVIILITEIPAPPTCNAEESAIAARNRLRREVVHRLASGPKTHSEMAEVHHVLSHRDNLILCDEGKHINPDDASGAALESVLNDVAIRRTRIGDADQWDLRKSAWLEYDPAFHRIGTRAHQSATERRPKQHSDHSLPYAPSPPPAHESFERIRKDITADATILSIVYRVFHAYCHDERSTKSTALLRGKEMYESGTRSEASVARAIHILTLGAFVWQNNSSSGGTDVGSVLYHLGAVPSVEDWVAMALLRSPEDIMNNGFYEGESNMLLLLNKLASETILNDHALRSGAAWLCNFAVKYNPVAAKLLQKGSSDVASTRGGDGQNHELEKRKAMAKARQQQAMEKMKAQMAKFAEVVGGDDTSDCDEMSVQETSASPHIESETFEQRTFTTPIRNRADSEADSSLHAMDLGSPGEFILTTPPPSYPSTPRTPLSSGSVTPQNSSICPAVNRLLSNRPQCIICGTDSAVFQDESLTSTAESKSLAFCAYAQSSTVAKGGRSLTDSPEDYWKRQVGVFVNLCGHAVHSSCCEKYLKTVNRDDRYIDRLDGNKRKEFRCPLCQRLSNSLVPFIDVAVDWIETPEKTTAAHETDQDKSDMTIDNTYYLHDFLSSTPWWTSRNDKSLLWDGHCSFSTEVTTDTKPTPSHTKPSGTPTMKQVLGKKELISAWNRVLKTPRLVQRSARGFTPNRSSDSDLSFPTNLEPERQSQRVADVWRRFLDIVSDLATKTDAKRLGEDLNDFGEFRHYLMEKAFYNKMNKSAGKESVDWPACISSVALSESRRQELSKEKLLSKLLFSIQSFVYSCCSEAAEARREYLNSSDSGTTTPAESLSVILAQFGLERVLLHGDLLLFPKASSFIDEGSQPFDGRLGKLRYLGLALMSACSPISSEIVQLCAAFPFSHSDDTKDPFNFDEHLKQLEKKRAPVVYPLLRGHILTHITCCLIAVTGHARIDGKAWDVNSTVHDCRQFIALGLVARTAQYLLSKLMPANSNTNDWKRNMKDTVDNMTSQKSGEGGFSNVWFSFCLFVLRAFAEDAEKQSSAEHLTGAVSNQAQATLQAIDSAKLHVVEYLRDICVIYQVLIPNVFVGNEIEATETQDTLDWKLQTFMTLLGIESLTAVLGSDLVKELLRSWFKESTERSPSHLETINIFPGITWPQSPTSNSHAGENNSSYVLEPLLGYCGYEPESESLCCISGLPRSYTDLYAELVILCPDCEQIALCLVCGEVLNASGKGECSRHALKCGGGAGIFFLLQECVSLLIHGVKAAYIHSPYVDSHGETPQYRGRHLNLSIERYEILRKLWSGHKVREKVVAERWTTRQVIIPNFY